MCVSLNPARVPIDDRTQRGGFVGRHELIDLAGGDCTRAICRDLQTTTYRDASQRYENGSNRVALGLVRIREDFGARTAVHRLLGIHERCIPGVPEITVIHTIDPHLHQLSIAGVDQDRVAVEHGLTT